MDLVLAQFCEEITAVLHRDPATKLTEHRRNIVDQLAHLSINRTTKSVLASLELPTLIKQFSHQEGKSSFEPLSPTHATPLMKVAELMWNQSQTIVIPRGTRSETPITLPALESGSQWPLVRVVVEPGCTVTLIDSHTATHDAILAHSTEVIIGEGSTVTFLSLSDRPSFQRILTTTRVVAEKDSSLTLLSALFGGNTGRYETEVTIKGSGVSIDQRLMHLTTGREHLECISNVVHAAPQSTSRITVRGALGGTSYVRFEGKIVITPGSQMTDAALDEKTLFLSDTAKHDSVPSLEINADDVKAAHASSISKCDPEELFYCMSRGIEEKEARALIIDGMFRALLTGCNNEITTVVDQRLSTHLNGQVI